MTYQSILPRHRLRRHNTLTPGYKPPPSRPKRPIQDPAILDFGQIHNAVGFDFHVLGVCGFEKHGADLGGKWFVAYPVETAGPVDFLVAGVVAFRGQFEGLVGEAGTGDVGGCWGAGEGFFDGFGAGGRCGG